MLTNLDAINILACPLRRDIDEKSIMEYVHLGTSLDCLLKMASDEQ